MDSEPQPIGTGTRWASRVMTLGVTVLNAIGFAGVPEDLATWGGWLMLEWVRWLLLVLGMPLVFMWVLIEVASCRSLDSGAARLFSWIRCLFSKKAREDALVAEMLDLAEKQGVNRYLPLVPGPLMPWGGDDEQPGAGKRQAGDGRQ